MDDKMIKGYYFVVHHFVFNHLHIKKARFFKGQNNGRQNDEIFIILSSIILSLAYLDLFYRKIVLKKM